MPRFRSLRHKASQSYPLSAITRRDFYRGRPGPQCRRLTRIDASACSASCIFDGEAERRGFPKDHPLRPLVPLGFSDFRVLFSLPSRFPNQALSYQI